MLTFWEIESILRPESDNVEDTSSTSKASGIGELECGKGTCEGAHFKVLKEISHSHGPHLGHKVIIVRGQADNLG